MTVDMPDLPSCGWSTVETNFSEWVQIFQKNLFWGEPILGGSKLNVTGPHFSNQDSRLDQVVEKAFALQFQGQ